MREPEENKCKTPPCSPETIGQRSAAPSPKTRSPSRSPSPLRLEAAAKIKDAKTKDEKRPHSNGQYIHERRKMPYTEISPYDVKRVYKTEDEINRAIAKGTFTHSKLMHMNWNDKNVFFLCYDK